jgi:hypothetical protein
MLVPDIDVSVSAFVTTKEAARRHGARAFVMIDIAVAPSFDEEGVASLQD